MIPQKDRIEAAIRHIQTAADVDPWAMELAVEALKAQGTCEDAVSRQTLQKELALYPIDDVTSEDEAGYNRAINDVQKMVLHLPSAQPERTEYIPNTKAIPSERDCVDLSERVTATFYDEEYEEWSQKTVTIRDVLDSVCDEYTILPSAQPKSEERTAESAQNVPKEDLISRKAAIDDIDDYLDEYSGLDEEGYHGEKWCAMAEAKMVIEKLPSAQPNLSKDELRLIKKLRSFHNGTYAKVLDKLISSAHPERKTGKWIPCSERLPEYGVAVLTYDGSCYCVEKRIPTIRDDNGDPISSEWWVSDDYDENNSEYYPNLRDGACIAWMPLPEPYEEGEQNG